MKRTLTFKSVLAGVLALAFLSIMTSDVLASHFRGGHLTWQRVSGNTVNITIKQYWRCCPSSVSLGDGNSVGAGTLIFSGTDLNGEAVEIYENTFTHTYPNAGPFTLELSPSCCRIGSLQNAANADWRVQTIVDMRNGQTGSSVSSLPPILQVAKGPNSINLVVADPDSSAITCRQATFAESSIPSPVGTGGTLADVTSSCILNWDATNFAHKSKHALQVAIFEGGLRTSLDVILEVNGGLVNNDPPTCGLIGPANSVVPVGQAFSISATGTDPEGGNLVVNHLGLPAGATLTPTTGSSVASPATATVNWTPAVSGTFAATLIFTDNGNQTCQTSFTVTVPSNQPPVANAGASQTVEQDGPAGSNVTLNGTASSDPDSDPLTYNWTGPFGTATGATPTVLMPAGTNNVTLVVNDGTVDSAPATTSVTVQDTIAPVVTAPADVTVEATGPQTAVAIGTATATDAVGVVSISSDAPADYTASTTTVVTWTACDAAGNCGTATQNVSIVDTTAPVITAPADITTAATGPLTPVSTGTATATDAVGVVSITSDQPAGFPVDATTVVTWTACDAAGNCSSATQNVSIDPFVLDLNVTKAKLKKHHDGDKDKDKDKDNDRGPKDWMQVSGTFSEFANGDGLNFTSETVTLTIDGLSWTLPAGSFVARTSDGDKDKDKDSDGKTTWKYKGPKSGLSEVRFDSNGKFKIKVKRMDLSAIPYGVAQPLTVRIGNDLGETTVTFNTGRGKNDDDKGKDKDKDRDKKSKSKSKKAPAKSKKAPEPAKKGKK